jgi:hypothetical protein
MTMMMMMERRHWHRRPHQPHGEIMWIRKEGQECWRKLLGARKVSNVCAPSETTLVNNDAPHFTQQAATIFRNSSAGGQCLAALVLDSSSNAGSRKSSQSVNPHLINENILGKCFRSNTTI